MNVELSINEHIFRMASDCLKSGKPMPSDEQLAVSFSTSKPTVANAIYRLRLKGHLETDGRRVISVTPTKTRAPRSRKLDGVQSPKTKLLALVKHCDWEGVRWPPRRNIAEALNISIVSLDSLIGTLTDEGLIYRAAPGVYRMGAGV